MAGRELPFHIKQSKQSRGKEHLNKDGYAMSHGESAREARGSKSLGQGHNLRKGRHPVYLGHD